MPDYLISRIAPQQFISEEDAYDYLPEMLEQLFTKKILFLHGIKSLQKALPYLPDLSKTGIVTVDQTFGGECSDKEINRMIRIIQENDIDLIVGLGGGKVLDTAKAAAYKSGNKPLVLMPTMASNCAAWSALSVLYKENGVSIGHQIYPKQANLVLIEPRVILDSPVDYFIAGIADTLAKWYESDSLLSNADQSRLALIYARQSARICHDVPINYAEQAIEDMKQGVLSDAWKLVMETNIMAGGLVGGFGDAFTRATAAHSVHDALTAFPETKHMLHGIKVAYGIMVQLVLEKNWKEIRQLQPFYRKLHLPMTLADLHLDGRPEDDIHHLAALATSPDKTIHLLPFKVTANSVYSAIKELENLSLTKESAQESFVRSSKRNKSI
jgi:uncharacterized oxidoreductase